MKSGHAVNVAGGSGHTETVSGKVAQAIMVSETCTCQSSGNIDEVPPKEDRKSEANVGTLYEENVKRHVAREVLLHENIQAEYNSGQNYENAHDRYKGENDDDDDDYNLLKEDFDRTPRPSYCFGKSYKICDRVNEVFQSQKNDNFDVNLDCKCNGDKHVKTSDDDCNITVTEDLNRTPRNSYCFGHPWHVGLNWPNFGNYVCWNNCQYVCFLNKFRRADCRSNSI
ncbi:hypothetical protein WDU94_004845 [Cyamophila willieti]